MKLTHLFPFAIAGLVLPTACVSNEDAIGQTESDVTQSDDGAYFLVTRQDLRKCMYPMCGGVFVKRVNNQKTRCADGAWAEDCHAVDVDLSALGLGEEQTWDVRYLFESGFGLVRGHLVEVQTEGGIAHTLVATEAWAGQALVAPEGTFYDVKNSGVKCVTFPCPSFSEKKLNTHKKPAAIAGVDLAASGASDEAVGLGYEQSVSGVLVAGTHVTETGPGGSMNALVASELYLEVTPASPGHCGGFAGFTCDEGYVCDYAVEDGCGFADALGTCVLRPDVCPAVVMPVCGCNGETYGNDCERLQAGVGLAHDGPCESANCGLNVCGAGEYCCNESCGICAPEGGFCTQQVCS
jgi:hypothetical protein